MIIIEIKSDSRYPIDRKKIRQAVVKQLKRAGIREGVEVSIAIVGNRKMKGMVKKFLGEEKPHNVLAFPLENTGGGAGVGFISPPRENLQLGDVVVSYPEALKQAIKNNRLVDDEISWLVEHGMKHLLGENH